MPSDIVRKRLSDKILSFMGEGIDEGNDKRFNALALEVFAYQFERNAVYERFCKGRGKTPATVKEWPEIPAVPTTAFREFPMACFPVEKAVAVYESSGTTGTKRSQHYLATLELYEASLKPNFQAHFLPDEARLPMLALALPPAIAPHSSLTHMLGVVMRQWGTDASRWYLNKDGLQKSELLRDLKRFEKLEEPVALLGTAFAFVHLLDFCAEQGVHLHLPSGSRIMDTGGYKGRSREVPKAELYELYERVLGVPDDHVVNEYGMTEMGSQFYDTVLREERSPSPYPPPSRGRKEKMERGMSPSLLGPPEADRETLPGRPIVGRVPSRKPSGDKKRDEEKALGISAVRHKVGPAWVRTQVVDPETMLPTKAGSVGLLRHFDLANLDSVMAIQTDDLGVERGAGFEILGRAKGAEARGCSIAVDEMLSQSKGAR